MESKYQSSWSCSSQRDGSQLEITSVLLCTSYEASVCIKVNVKSYKIEYARWDVYRSPACVIVRSGEIPVLIGTHVREYSTKLVLQTLDPDLREILVELILESIKGALLSENFVLKEHGYLSFVDFKKESHKLLLDSCYCFSNPERSGTLWRDYMGQQGDARIKNLFNRHKNYQIFANPDGSLFSTACFADSYHEILLTVYFTECGQIKNILGKFLRSPNELCCESIKIINNLIGKNLSKITKKELAALVGGSSGCTHIFETCYSLGLALSASQAQN